MTSKLHTYTCRNCGHKGLTLRSTRRYCSSTCRAAAWKRQKRFEAWREKIRGDEGWRECEMWPDCDRLIAPDDPANKRFCSNACKQKYYRECGGPPIPADVLGGVGDLINSLRAKGNANEGGTTS